MSKVAVSVTEMAKMVFLSRSRFYQLVDEGKFPPPDKIGKKSCYMQEKQQQIIQCRNANCGINGEPVLFYSRRIDIAKPRKKIQPQPKVALNDILRGLMALNVQATARELDQLISRIYPGGIENIERGELVKSLFLEIKRQNTTNNVDG